MTITSDTPGDRFRTGFLRRLGGLGPRSARPDVVTDEEALVRALCHDLGTPLASLQALLGHLVDEAGQEGADAQDVTGLALAQADSMVSMLRTASATGGALPATGWPRALVDVVRASLQASGLPVGQVHLAVQPDAAQVPVGDARVQRILTNLLENAHRHGEGRPVEVAVEVRAGWVRLVVSQSGVPDRVVEHLRARRPPGDLTGLGLWSVQRQAHELGGRVTCRRGATGLGVVVDLPDR